VHFFHAADEYLTTQMCICGGKRAKIGNTTEQCCEECGLTRIRDISSAGGVGKIIKCLAQTGQRPVQYCMSDKTANRVRLERASRGLLDEGNDGNAEEDDDNVFSDSGSGSDVDADSEVSAVDDETAVTADDGEGVGEQKEDDDEAMGDTGEWRCCDTDVPVSGEYCATCRQGSSGRRACRGRGR